MTRRPWEGPRPGPGRDAARPEVGVIADVDPDPNGESPAIGDARPDRFQPPIKLIEDDLTPASSATTRIWNCGTGLSTR